MSKIQIALSSPAFWSMVGVFFLAGLSAVVPSLHGTLGMIAMMVIAGLGAILHPAEVQKAGSINAGRIR